MDQEKKDKLKYIASMTRVFTELYNQGNINKSGLIKMIKALAHIYGYKEFLQILKDSKGKYKTEFEIYKKTFDDCKVEFD